MTDIILDCLAIILSICIMYNCIMKEENFIKSWRENMKSREMCRAFERKVLYTRMRFNSFSLPFSDTRKVP